MSSPPGSQGMLGFATTGDVTLPQTSLGLNMHPLSSSPASSTPPLHQELPPLTDHVLIPSLDSLPALQRIMLLQQRELQILAGVGNPLPLQGALTHRADLLNSQPTTTVLPDILPATTSPQLLLGPARRVDPLSAAAQLRALQAKEAELTARMQWLKEQKESVKKHQPPNPVASSSPPPEACKLRGKLFRKGSSKKGSSAKAQHITLGSMAHLDKKVRGRSQPTIISQDSFHAAVAAQLLEDMAKGQAPKGNTAALKCYSPAKPRQGGKSRKSEPSSAAAASITGMATQMAMQRVASQESTGEPRTPQPLGLTPLAFTDLSPESPSITGARATKRILHHNLQEGRVPATPSTDFALLAGSQQLATGSFGSSGVVVPMANAKTTVPGETQSLQESISASSGRMKRKVQCIDNQQSFSSEGHPLCQNALALTGTQTGRSSLVRAQERLVISASEKHRRVEVDLELKL